MKRLVLFSAICIGAFTISHAQWTNVKTGIISSGAITVHNGKLFVTSSGVDVSSDGMNWSNKKNGLTGAALQTKGLGSANGYLYLGTAFLTPNGGVFNSNDDGDTWNYTDTANLKSSALSYGLNFFYFNNVTYCVKGGGSSAIINGGGIYRSTDNGATWASSHAGITSSATPYKMALAGTDLFVGTNLGVYKSSDNGVNWTKVNGIKDAAYPSLIEHKGRLMSFTTDPTNAFVYSDDNGANWTSVATFNIATLSGNGPYQRMAVGANDTLFASISSEGIFYSIDKGDNWTDITGNITGNDKSLLFDLVLFKDTPYILTFGGVYKKGGVLTSPCTGITINVNTTVTNESSVNAKDGTISTTVTGGTTPYTYNWNNSASTQTISSLSSGTYTVTVSDANSCTVTASATILVETSTGIKNNQQDTKISLFPNPTSSSITLLSSETISSIELRNINGILVDQIIGFKNQIDLSIYNTGVYFLRIKHTNGKEYIEKILKY